MRILTAGIIALAFFASCGGEKKTSDLEAMKQLLANKRAEAAAIQSEIRDLEDKIKELDTTIVDDKISVTTLAISKKNFARYVDLQGTLATDDPGFASSETGGRIVRMHVKEGQVVSKGSLIASIDLGALEKSMDEIDNRIFLAREVFERQANLWKQNIGSEIQYLQAKNALDALLKSKETLKFQMTKADVYAPIAGTVDKVILKAGEMAGPGSPIVQIINLSTLKVLVDIPENYLKSVRVGANLQVEFPALGPGIVPAQVVEVARFINPANRTFQVKALLNNSGGLYKPNLLANVKFKEAEETAVVVVPTEYILQDVNGQDYVFVADKGSDGGSVAKKVYVTRGSNYMGESSIRSGLNGGESMIIEGARNVSENTNLDIIGPAVFQNLIPQIAQPKDSVGK